MLALSVLVVSCSHVSAQTIGGTQTPESAALAGLADTDIERPPEARFQGRLDHPDEHHGPLREPPSAGPLEYAIFIDALADFGNVDESLFEENDRFSLRETQVELRVPVAAWAEAVLIGVIEDEGDGAFEPFVEEGYVDLALGGLLGNDSTAEMKLGRFRLPFGLDNKRHTHDLMQADRAQLVQRQLGEEGLVGEGLELTLPLWRASTLQLAVVRADLFTAEESLMDELAQAAGIELDSDSLVLAARWSELLEFGDRTDLELGASWLRGLGTKDIETDAGSEIEPEFVALDARLRSGGDSSGVGHWIGTAQFLEGDVKWGGSVGPGFPSGRQRTRGWSLSAQRAMTPTVSLGLRLGASDLLGTDQHITDASPYVSWYPVHNLRIRLQAQHLDLDSGEDNSTATRALLQFTWNFGSHEPHH